MGDATNSVMILAGEMLKKAEQLLIMGLHPSEIIKGYELASEKALAELESTSISSLHRLQPCEVLSPLLHRSSCARHHIADIYPPRYDDDSPPIVSPSAFCPPSPCETEVSYYSDCPECERPTKRKREESPETLPNKKIELM